MNELTDLEICKKIAEIEGHKPAPDDDYKKWHLFPKTAHILIERHGKDGCYSAHYDEYNPLSISDKTLLWDLMVKYQVCIEFETAEYGIIEIWPLDAETSALIGTYSSVFDSSDGLPRAVLLAIIEAHDNG